MLIEHQHPSNRSIIVSVLGAPNVGKSTLVNTLLGMDLSVVTSKAQTTRNRFKCIFTIDHTEIILVDTPGLHRSNQEFNKRLNEQARESVDTVDLNLILIDLAKPILGQFADLAKILDRNLGPSWVIFTKADKIENASELPLGEAVEKAKEIIPSIEKHYIISAKAGENVHVLTGDLVDRAEPGPHLFPGGEVSDKNERFFVTEYIREQAFLLLKEEIPYEVAVVIDEYQDFVKKDGDKNEDRSHISATILVNRPSQRGIVVGKGGEMIKEIGTRSREKIETMLGHQVHLNLHVKVSPKWFKNNFVLEELGLPRAKDSARVWRKK
jgi:GTP-binding protein Era